LTVIKGPSGEKVGHYSDIEAQRVNDKLAVKTWIRWLISKDDGAPTFAMRLFEVEVDGWIKAHRHPWEHEIFIVSGDGEVRIGDKRYKVSQGDFIYIPPSVEHEYWNRGDKSLWFICIIPNEPSVKQGEE